MNILSAKVISRVMWPDAVSAVHAMATSHDGTEFLQAHLDMLEAATSLVRSKILNKKWEKERENEQAQEG